MQKLISARACCLSLVLLSGALACSLCAAAQEPGLTARDMFYSAADLVGKKPAGKKATVHRPHVSGPGTTVKVASAPLGLRYSVLRRGSSKQYQEVPPDTVFHAGDKLRLSVMSNEKGYLYIVQQGSSGTWSPLFPNPDINAGRNLVEAGRNYEIPSGPGEGFLLDENAGEEKLFIMLTRKPEPDLENVVMSLRQGRPGQDRPGNDSQTETAQAHPVQSQPLNDDVVQRMRQQIGARDLIFTKVDDKDEKEKAVYVVNSGASANPNSRVVVDLKLNHK